MSNIITVNGFTHYKTKSDARKAIGVHKTATINSRATLRKIWKDKEKVGYWASQIPGKNPNLSIQIIRANNVKKNELASV